MTLDDLGSRDLPPHDAAEEASGPDAAPPPDAMTADRSADLRLARLHLRVGSLTLARAELEAAHAVRPLVGPSLLDLAEARWRSGDLVPAGVAAEAWMATAGTDHPLLATVIGVEAALADGRPSDAHRLMDAAPAASPDELDGVFNGMPRNGIWPGEVGPASVASTVALSQTPLAARHAGRGPGPLTPGAPTIDALAELDGARTNIDAGETLAAAVRLSLVLRVGPHLAPAVLELLEDVSGPLLDVVRGDAYRIVGREAEAERAWRAAAAEIDDVRGEDQLGAARERRAEAPAAAAPYASVASDTHSVPASRHSIRPGLSAPDAEPPPEENP